MGAGLCGEGACSRSTAKQSQSFGVAARPSGSKLPLHTNPLPHGICKPLASRFQGYSHVPRPSLQLRVLPYEDRRWA
ncbi:hypothetical protein DJ564_30460 [Pseudomonas sp. 31-12]|nr:hypothetical protein DJ564_30460 [Pseudomonas sp. 31-12]